MIDPNPTLLRFVLRLTVALVCLLSLSEHGRSPVWSQTPLVLEPGQRIAIIGNTTADRLQHDGWLETYVHALHPQHDLVFRNLGFPGDELKVRVREENFGSADQWLSKVQADVVFAFFGYNESLRGLDHLPTFRRELAETIDQMRGQKYNGQSPPTLVFFSPIAHEDLGLPYLPDGQANNERLNQFTAAMAEVCREKGVAFVDLFAPTLAHYSQAQEPLTINGVHVSESGGRVLAGMICQALFGRQVLTQPAAEVERLRAAILERNDYWFSRYRVVDGYNVFGGRSTLSWFGQSNADVMMREMEIFDVMTANRDRRVWAVAQGSDLQVEDNNLPPELDVRTNKPGDLPDGAYTYLTAEQSAQKMKLADGMAVNVFASEAMFPELINPVQMAVDPDGDLFVAVWPSYPHWNPTQPREDRILRLRDEDGDGVADSSVVFADQLNSVTGFEFWGGGMLVAALPELWFLKDTTGDGRADVRVRLVQGLSSADSHHSANAMLLGPDGWLYWSRGIFNVACIETPTKTFRSEQSGVYRFNPRSFEMEFHFPIGPNPHGNVVDQWGYMFASDGTTGTGSYVNIGRGMGNKQWFPMRVRPVSSTGILSSSHFPPANQGNFLIANTIGFLGVLQHEVSYNGADIRATEIDPILVSDDPNFRPSDLEIGADGALYVADWCNALIGHMQHNMRDPNRDNRHGRIYRVTYPGRPLLTPKRLRGRPIAEVCEAFLAPENATRYRARIELSGRDLQSVRQDVLAWAATRDIQQPADAQALLECLWVFAEQQDPQPELLQTVLQAAEPRVRAAAVRTLGQWAGKVPAAAEWLWAAAEDPAALVRAEAVKAAVLLAESQDGDGAGAAEAIYRAWQQPTDPELDAVLAYANNRLGIPQRLRQSIAKGDVLTPAALAYALQTAAPEDLAKLPPSEAVYQAMLNRSDLPVALLDQALTGLAKVSSVDPLALSFDLWEQRDQQGPGTAVLGVGQWLLSRPTGSLLTEQTRLGRLATQGQQMETRRLAYALLLTAADSPDRTFSLASANPQSLPDFVGALDYVLSPERLVAIYPLLRGLALSGADEAEATLQPGVRVDYFTPDPPNVAAETLAARQPQDSGIVPSLGLDVPQRARTDHYALRFDTWLSVPTTGRYRFWLTSDDGSRLYLNEQLLIDNDGPHGMVEKGARVELTAGRHRLTLNYFNATGGYGLKLEWAGPGFERQEIAADRLSVGDQEVGLRQQAVLAFQRVPGLEIEKWNDLTTLLKAGVARRAAIQVLSQIPAQQRPTERLADVADNLIAYLSELPTGMRTGDDALRAIDLVKSVAQQLSPELSAPMLERLENLDVRVIAIGTVQERMIFDKEQIVVQAGRPVEFRFTNSDFMPHNFVIVQPGSLETIGDLAEATARDADAKERHYVPPSPAVILASRLLESNQSESLIFEAPTEPGVYPFVCTYPGHWRRMHGAIYVVADLEAYQADPAAYLAANPLEFQDEILRFIARNNDWQYDALVEKVSVLSPGRSFEVGRQLFRSANCVACHQFGGEGYALGPDLANLTAEHATAEALLRSLLEPSQRIDEKYRSYTFLLESGQVVTGTIVEEDERVVKVLTDPLNVREPTEILVEEIEARKAADTSIMPAGLLNKLTEEEIVDLLAYLQAGAKRDHPVYADGHDHHSHEGQEHGSHDSHEDEHDHDDLPDGA